MKRQVRFLFVLAFADAVTAPNLVKFGEDPLVRPLPQHQLSWPSEGGRAYQRHRWPRTIGKGLSRRQLLRQQRPDEDETNDRQAVASRRTQDLDVWPRDFVRRGKSAYVGERRGANSDGKQFAADHAVVASFTPSKAHQLGTRPLRLGEENEGLFQAAEEVEALNGAAITAGLAVQLVRNMVQKGALVLLVTLCTALWTAVGCYNHWNEG